MEATDIGRPYVRGSFVTVTTYRPIDECSAPTIRRATLTPVTGYLDGEAPRAYAHRGWHVDDLAGLENSMRAFRRAFDEGYRYLETDVHATADGVLVAFHDLRLDRVTDRHGMIANLPWSDVKRARIAGTEPIPLMSDVLEELPQAKFNIDAKAAGAVGPLVDLIKKTGAADRVCLG